MDLSIIIVSYNTRELLSACIQSVIDSTQGVSYEIIVVDNNSTDGSQQMLNATYPDITLLCNHDNIGFSCANNQGYRSSNGEYLLFLNSDTLILNNAIEKLAHYLDVHHDAGIVGPKILNEHHQPTRSYMQFMDAGTLFLGSKNLRFLFAVEKHRLHFSQYDYDSIQNVPWLSGASLMIARNIFEEAGLFDEHYFLYLEDMDLCLQVHKRGYQVVYFPHAEITHLFGGSSNQQHDRLNQLYNESMAYYFHKNYPGIQYFLAKLYIRFFTNLVRQRGHTS
jgi:GT2 family glycosyltransferase